MVHSTEHTIDAELVEELSFLAKDDGTKKAVRNIADIPDRLLDLFIRFCLQNNGRLSENKHGSCPDGKGDTNIIRK